MKKFNPFPLPIVPAIENKTVPKISIGEWKESLTQSLHLTSSKQVCVLLALSTAVVQQLDRLQQ